MFKVNFPKKEKLISAVKVLFEKVCSVVTGILSTASAYCKAAYSFLKANVPVVRQVFVNFLKTADSMKVKIIAVITATVCCLTITVIAYAVEQKSAVQVYYGGCSYGFVSDMKTANYVADTVKRSVHGEVDTASFKLRSVTVAENMILSGDEVIKGISENADGIVSVSGLYVDGVLKAVANDYSSMQAALNSGIRYFTTEGFEFKGFATDVVLRDIYTTVDFAEKHLIKQDKLLNGDYGVGFMTSRVENFDEEIAFNEVTEQTDKQYTTYSKVTQKGKNGLRNVTADVMYVNGVKSGAEEIESTVITPATDKITVVGTKQKPVYHSGYVLATSIMSDESASMVFPVECNGSTYISSFWGDGRGHKGLDIAAPRGSDVYAAANGKVSYVGYRSDYGYLIVVDHYDGKTQTYYSHNKANLVKVGDAVTAGQKIATVGATGNATGNHLHFAVMINGTAVDPAPYVGLK